MSGIDSPLLPPALEDAASRQMLLRVLQPWMREAARRIGALASGRVAGRTTAAAAPLSGMWAQGDFVANAAPVEAGVVGVRYVVAGWLCVASGEPGTWVQCRYLTGN